jgi:hypothetical protein
VPSHVTEPERPDPAELSGVNRRMLLRGVGLTAMASALPLALRPTEASAAATGTSAAGAISDTLPILSGNEFPIGLFWPPPPFQTTLRRYAEIKEAGFTFVISGNYLDDHYILQRQLALSSQVGLKVLVASDPDIENMAHNFTISDDRSVPMSLSTEDAKTLVRRGLNNYKQFDSFAGFNLFDEPSADWFPTLGRALDVVRGADSTILPYTNLWPGNGDGYRAFVQSFVATVKPSLLSFDRYPLLSSGADDAGYFENLAIFRSAALAAGLPFWVYLQSVEFNGHRFPTRDEVRWQVNMSLAYGCTGIQYFTYWTPDPARGEGFTRALMSVDGERTDLYEASKDVNRTWLAPVGKELKQFVSERVFHANESPLPSGATGFTPDNYVTSVAGDPVVIGQFKDAAGTAKRWLLIANRSHSGPATATLTTHPGIVNAASTFDPRSGTYRSQSSATTITSRLAAGAAVLYRLDA